MKILRKFLIFQLLIITLLAAQAQQIHIIKKSKALEKYRKQFGLEENMIKPSKKSVFFKNPFLDEKDTKKQNRKLQENQLDQSQTDQLFSTGDKNLDDIIQGVKEYQKEGRPVIVINHKTQDDPFSLNKTPQQQSIQTQQQQNNPLFNPYQNQNNTQLSQEQLYNFSSLKIPKTQQSSSPYYLTQQDFQTLFETLSNISSIFHVFFDGFPQWEDESQSTIQKSVDMLRFYVKIKKFVNYIYENQSQLGKDVDYLSQRIHLLKSTQDDMLRFYELDHLYFEANLKYHKLTFNGKQTLKQQIDNEFQQISETTYLYDTDVRKAFSSVYNLNKFTQFFLQQIDNLKTNQYQSSLMNALDKFDAIMMLTYRVLTMKADIEKSIINLQESLQNIKTYKPQLQLNLETIQKYLELVRLTEKEEVKQDKKKTYLFTSCILLIVFLFFD